MRAPTEGEGGSEGWGQPRAGEVGVGSTYAWVPPHTTQASVISTARRRPRLMTVSRSLLRLKSMAPPVTEMTSRGRLYPSRSIVSIMAPGLAFGDTRTNVA